jgi:hypothetical protein
MSKEIKVFEYEMCSIQKHFTKGLYGSIEITKNMSILDVFDAVSECMNRQKYLNGHYDHSSMRIYPSQKSYDSGGGVWFDPRVQCSFSCGYEMDNPYETINDLIYVRFGPSPCHHLTIYKNKTCIICLRELISGDGLVINNSCGHELFCRQCADQALLTITKCPICNTHIDDPHIPDCPYSLCYECNRFSHKNDCKLINRLPWREQIFRA